MGMGKLVEQVALPLPAEKICKSDGERLREPAEPLVSVRRDLGCMAFGGLRRTLSKNVHGPSHWSRGGAMLTHYLSLHIGAL